MSPIGISTSRSSRNLSTAKAKLWLVLVGVNQYQDQQLPSLRYSAVDCQGLAEALQDATQEFTPKQVLIHHDFAEQLPSLGNVRASLKLLSTAAKPQDTVLFYFSGHGMLEPNTLQAFLCLADTQKSNLQNTGLALQELLQLLGNCAAQNQLVWLDACHSGGMKLRDAAVLSPTPQLVQVLQQRAATSKGFYALLSCDTNQQSWEFPELGHGVFTYYLMRGLHGEAADSSGVITADGLYRYVYHQTLQYIDKTNQQLRLINQQKRGRGDTALYSEYSLQTPKRIVDGVGELILGKRPEKAADAVERRIAVVVEGLSASKTTLDISKLLRSAGGFELEYWQAGKAAADIRETISHHLQPSTSQAESGTILLYLRGRIEETEAWEGLVLGEDIRLKRSWLKQQLRRSNAKQIIILDCPVGMRHSPSLQDWVEELQIDSHQGQCLIVCGSSVENPERFAQILLDTLMATSQSAGLSAAGWIAQLQMSLAGSNIPLHVWLSGTQGIIEVLPAKTNSPEQTAGLDLGVCPYMGLSAFGEQDAQYFYGRETLTQELVYQLNHRSFLAVIGASGSGKSSVVQAGLIPQLRFGKQIPSSEQWWIRTVRPGANPLEALSHKLVDASTPEEKAKEQLQLEGILHQGVEGFVYWIRSRPYPVVVLVVDQFEELFTLAPAADRERFLELVLGAVEYAKDRFKLIITLRADFIASCLEVPALAEALQQSSVLVPPRLSLDDYRRVIVNPAEQVGLKVEAKLIEVLLQELSHSPGDLPLLEFVLEQLWEHRYQGELTLQAYQQQIGGIKGALERKAQAVYDSLDSEAQVCAKWIFLALTQLGEGTEDTRRRLLKSELIVKKYPAALVERTLQVLTTAKLVVMNLEADEDSFGNSRGMETTLPLSLSSAVTVEVAHEILIRHWSTLRWWLEENRARLRSQREIEQAAMLWQQSGKQSDFLLQGVRLAQAEDIYIKYTDELSQDVQQFIEACLHSRYLQQLQAKRRQRMAQVIAGVISALGLAALGLGGLAYQQSQKAQLQEIEALNSLSENFLLYSKQLEGLIASVKAGKQLQRMTWFGNAIAPVNTQTTTLNTLSQAVADTQQRNSLEGHQSWVTSVKFSPDGEMIASASWDNTIKLWRRDGTLIKTFTGHGDGISSVSFSPDGETIASASDDKTIRLWQRDGTLIKTLTGHSSGVNSVSFSPDGKTIVSGSNDDTVKIWNKDGQLLKTLQGDNEGVNSAIFAPNGETIASANNDGTVKLWSKEGKLLHALKGHTDEAISVSFSPDGQTLISGSHDKTIKFWSVKSGTLQKTLPGHSSWVMGVSYSPQGNTIASASADQTIKLWSLEGILLKTFSGHNEGVNKISFSPDGKTIASASDDSTIKLWTVDEILPQTLQGHSDDVINLSFSPQGNTIASASDDGTIKLWSNNGQLLKTLQGHKNPVISVTFSPDGNAIASASADGTIKLWSKDGSLLNSLLGHTSWVTSVKFSPDGSTIASASADKTVKLWSRDGRLLKNLPGHTSWVTSVSFSPDGSTIASTSADRTVKIWSRDGNLLTTLQGHSGSVWSVSFSPNGEQLASTSADRTVKIWSRDGQILNTFQGHTDEVISASFSPDGKTIASASADDTIKLWNLASGRLLKTLQGHGGDVRGISFSPDGRMIASAGGDDTIKLWHLEGIELQTLDLNALLERGCNWLHDYLKTNPNLTERDRHICDE